jgi:heme exporter protein CcmD
MMSIFEEKYFGYIASAYGITLVVFIGLIIWVVVQQRGHQAKLARMEKQGITRRSSRKSMKGSNT